jgi:hypothetical protein
LLFGCTQLFCCPPWPGEARCARIWTPAAAVIGTGSPPQSPQTRTRPHRRSRPQTTRCGDATVRVRSPTRAAVSSLAAVVRVLREHVHAGRDLWPLDCTQRPHPSRRTALCKATSSV